MDDGSGAFSLVSDASARGSIRVVAIQVSPGHNFFGHSGGAAGTHPITSVAAVECLAGRGLRGDRFLDYKKDYAGQITFFAEEVHEQLLREMSVRCSPAAYRRNVIVRNADLNALIGHEFAVQGVRFLGVGEAKPCHWMNEAVGAGVEVWLRGRGGLRAKILNDGEIRVDLPQAAALLLAGGRSTRMGRDKAGLPWAHTTLGEHQAAMLTDAGLWPLLISCRQEQSWTPAAFSRVEDRAADGGVLAALTDAFAAVPATVLVALAVDLPKVTPTLLHELASTAREQSVSVVPRQSNGGFEPLAAAWHRSAQPELQNALAAHRSLQDVCRALLRAGRLRVRELSASESEWLANVNTPGDLDHLT